MRYTVPKFFPYQGDLVLRADVFNIFNSRKPVNVQNVAENGTVLYNAPATGSPLSATRTPVFGMPITYQTPRYVRVGFDLYYTDEQGSYLMQGQLIDVKAKKNLTEERVDKLSQVAFDQLPVKDAFKIAHDEALYLPLHQQPVAWAMSDKVDMPQFPDEYVRPWFAQMK